MGKFRDWLDGITDAKGTSNAATDHSGAPATDAPAEENRSKVIVPKADASAKHDTPAEPDPANLHDKWGAYYVLVDESGEEYHRLKDYPALLQQRIEDSGLKVAVDAMIALQMQSGVLHTAVFYLDDDGNPITDEPCNPATAEALLKDYDRQSDPSSAEPEAVTLDVAARVVKRLNPEDYKKFLQMAADEYHEETDNSDDGEDDAS